MGAVSLAAKKQGVMDNKKVVEADVTFSASYATGGDTVSLAALGLVAVDEILVPSHDLISRKAVASTRTRTGKSVELAGTKVAPKLALYETNGTEVVAATDVSTVTMRVRFLGR